jgi:hypothetical protein
MEIGSVETWKPVVGHPDYEVSSEGRVRRVTAAKGTYAGRLLSPGLGSHGYFGVHLGAGTSRLVHRLMAEAFLPRVLGCGHVNHLNGIKTDNRLENLEWSNKSLNQRHAMKQGLYKGPPLKQGEAQGNAKLTEEQVRYVRQQRATGTPILTLARELSVSQSLISYVCHHGWKHIT